MSNFKRIILPLAVSIFAAAPVFADSNCDSTCRGSLGDLRPFFPQPVALNLKPDSTAGCPTSGHSSGGWGVSDTCYRILSLQTVGRATFDPKDQGPWLIKAEAMIQSCAEPIISAEIWVNGVFVKKAGFQIYADSGTDACHAAATNFSVVMPNAKGPQDVQFFIRNQANGAFFRGGFLSVGMSDASVNGTRFTNGSMTTF